MRFIDLGGNDGFSKIEKFLVGEVFRVFCRIRC